MWKSWHISGTYSISPSLQREREREWRRDCVRVTSLINVLYFRSVWVRPDGEATSSLRKALTILPSAFLNLIRCGNGTNNVLRYVCFGKMVSYISLMWDFSADIWFKEVLLWTLSTDQIVCEKRQLLRCLVLIGHYCSQSHSSLKCCMLIFLLENNPLIVLSAMQ